MLHLGNGAIKDASTKKIKLTKLVKAKKRERAKKLRYSDRRTIREANKEKILRELLKGKELKRKDIIKRTGLNPKTVDRCLNELKEEGWVISVKKGYWALNEERIKSDPTNPYIFVGYSIIRIIEDKRDEESKFRSADKYNVIKKNVQDIYNTLTRDLLKIVLLAKNKQELAELDYPLSLPSLILLVLETLYDYLNENRDLKIKALAEVYKDPSFFLT